MAKKKEKVTLTVDPDLKRRLERLAKIDGRSISNYLNMLIKRHIEGKKEV